MENKMKKAIIIIFVILLAANIQAKTFNVEKGVTTKKEITSWCGEPAIKKNIEGKECWFYDASDKSVLRKNEKMYMYFQFSDAGIVEDNYETTESSIPHIKPKSLQQVLKESEVSDRWALNKQKYGTPKYEAHKDDKIHWRYKISEKPKSEYIVEQVYKTIEFDKDGNFINESTSKNEAIVYKASSKDEMGKLLEALGEKYRNPEAVFNEKEDSAKNR